MLFARNENTKKITKIKGKNEVFLMISQAHLLSFCLIVAEHKNKQIIEILTAQHEYSLECNLQ